MKRIFIFSIIALCCVTAGCESLQNMAMEKMLGYEKRELLTRAVESVLKEQKKTQVEFKDALTQFKELYAFDGGDLEHNYDQFKNSYEDARLQAEALRKRIANMENIARSMFGEWAKEIKQYKNNDLAQKSREQLKTTKAKYHQLSKSVKASEASMRPVLAQLNDNVLYLKHNLNAAAIGSLKEEAGTIQYQIEELIKRMNVTISEADAFIKSMPSQ